MKKPYICLLIVTLLAVEVIHAEQIPAKSKKYLRIKICSGFNNQKMMLKHACFIAQQENYALLEPCFKSFLYKEDKDLWFSDIFDIQFFMDSLKNVEIVQHQFIDLIPEEDCISPYSSTELFYGQPKSEEYRAFSEMLEGCLRLNERNMTIAQAIQDKMPHDYVAIHMRIEPDWINYSKNKKVPAYQKVYVTKEEILKKYMDSELCDNKNLFFATAYRGEDLLELWEHNGFNVFSSTAEKKNLNYHIRAAIDFHVCVESKIFIGNCNTTFSNNVAMARAVLHKGDSYIYNMNDAKLYKRCDRGHCADAKMATTQRAVPVNP